MNKRFNFFKIIALAMVAVSLLLFSISDSSILAQNIAAQENAVVFGCAADSDERCRIVSPRTGSVLKGRGVQLEISIETETDFDFN